MDTKNTIRTLSQSLLDEVKKIMKKEKEEKSEKGESEADEKREHCSEALKGDQHKIDANKNGKVDAHDFKLLRKKKGVAETYAAIKSSEEISEEEEVEEAVKNPYAVGMAVAMKSTGDKPPLKKSTIIKGHEIAKKIKEETEDLGENFKRGDYIHVPGGNNTKHPAVHLGKKAVYLDDEGGVEHVPDSALAKATKMKKVSAHHKNLGSKYLENMKEDAEQIDELSRKTMSSYVKKAIPSMRGLEDASDRAHQKGHETYKAGATKTSDKFLRLSDRHLKKSVKRGEGINTALNKLAKEEVEDLEELSKSTLASYIGKASADVHNKAYRAGKIEGHHKKYDMDKIVKSITRQAGINKAATKLAKEEVELTQEEIDRLDAMMADLEEGRGRPPKEGSDAWKKRQEAGAAEQDEPRQHPIQQLERIKRDMRGGGDFKHKDGSTHHVTGAQASKLLDKYHGMKPAEKEAMQKEIHANHAGLKKHL